jgi:phospholipid/cholesterol/gamma-HCH transport system substrate-binding protein
MEREAHYAAVGAFVLVVTLIAALFVYWYSDTREHRHYNRYEIYFEGSVSGLERGAAVRYLGVGVGRVAEMRIDPRDSSRVEVITDIDATTPISPDTVAELQLQGVTGLLYIDLFEDRTHTSRTASVPSLKYPVIRSSPSRFDVFLQGLPTLVAQAGDVVQRASRLLSDKNIKAVDTAVGNVDTASRGLPQTVANLNSLIAELRAATGELSATARGAHALVDKTAPNVEGAAQQLRVMADHLADASDQLDRLVTENRQDVRGFVHNGLPEIERFVREGRATAQDIRNLSNSLRENPAQLLYEPPQRGVEIPR